MKVYLGARKQGKSIYNRMMAAAAFVYWMAQIGTECKPAAKKEQEHE